MRKFLLLGTIFVATNVWAFGGIGIGPWQRHKSSSGVDAIVIHIDPKGKKADIDIVDGDESQEEVCAEGILKDRFGHCNICENGNVYLSYMDDPCGTETEIDGNCVSNADCGADEFCKLTGSSCEKPNGGTCTAIGEIIGPAEIPGLGTVIGRQQNMSWWAADNWCKAQGKSLIDIREFNCYQNNTSTLIVENSAINSICFNSNQSGDSWDNYWNSYDDNPLTIKEGYETVINEIYSPVMVSFRQALGTWPFWTQSNYSSDNSCQVFLINPTNGSVDGWQRQALFGPPHTPLCK